MDEQRQFFRIKNNGEIKARIDEEQLEVIDLSCTGVLIKKKNFDVPRQGIIELTIKDRVISIDYKLLRIGTNDFALVFKKEKEIQLLFNILKNLRT